MKSVFLILAMIQIGCATIVKPERQHVDFVGGPEGGTTQITTPDGTTSFNGNYGKILITRSRQDIPLTVTCKDGPKSGLLSSQFDVLMGGFGNLVFGGIPGWIIDGTGNKAYDIPSPIDISQFCESNGKITYKKPTSPETKGTASAENQNETSTVKYKGFK